MATVNYIPHSKIEKIYITIGNLLAVKTKDLDNKGDKIVYYSCYPAEITTDSLGIHGNFKL